MTGFKATAASIKSTCVILKLWNSKRKKTYYKSVGSFFFLCDQAFEEQTYHSDSSKWEGDKLTRYSWVLFTYSMFCKTLPSSGFTVELQTELLGRLCVCFIGCCPSSRFQIAVWGFSPTAAQRPEAQFQTMKNNLGMKQGAGSSGLIITITGSQHHWTVAEAAWSYGA